MANVNNERSVMGIDGSGPSEQELGKSRTINDADLLKGGAEFTPQAGAGDRLEVSSRQWDQAHSEMLQDLKEQEKHKLSQINQIAKEIEAISSKEPEAGGVLIHVMDRIKSLQELGQEYDELSRKIVGSETQPEKSSAQGL